MLSRKARIAKNATGENSKCGRTTGPGDAAAASSHPRTLETATPGYQKAGTEMPRGGRSIAALPPGAGSGYTPWVLQHRLTQGPSHVHQVLP